MDSAAQPKTPNKEKNTPKTPKTPRMEWEELLEAKDLSRLMDTLRRRLSNNYATEAGLREIFGVVDELAAENLPGLIEQIYRQSISTAAMFVWRAQMGVHVSLHSSEVTSDARDLERVTEKLQSWEALAEHFMRTASKYASMRHVLALDKMATGRTQQPAKADAPQPMENVHASR